MKNLLILFFLFLISHQGFTQTNPQDEVLKKYFASFNQEAPSYEETRSGIEKRLLEIGKQAYQIIPSVTELKQRKQLALILVYTAMYVINNNSAILDGKISYSNLIKDNQFSSKYTLRDEIIARYQFADKYLSIAMKMAPEDGRIPSWYYSNLLMLKEYEFGTIDEKLLDEVTNIIASAPMFHLFNALTMNSRYNFGPEREKVFLEMTELMIGKDSPCRPLIKALRKGEAKKCNTTNKTPFARQGTSVYMSDVYVKEALKIRDIDQAKANNYLGKAQGLLMMAKLGSYFQTRRWSMKKNLEKRVHLVKKLKNGGDITEGYFKSKDYMNIYTCYSCHQSGAPSRVLDLSTLKGLIK